MKAVVITKRNFWKVKLSDLVESVLTDLERVKKKGFKINMDTWTGKKLNTWTGKTQCSVCLGGAAVMGFFNYRKSDMAIVDNIICNGDTINSQLPSLAKFFNCLRNKYAGEAVIYIRRMRKWEDYVEVPEYIVIKKWMTLHPSVFNYALGEFEIQRLKLELARLVKMLRANGF